MTARTAEITGFGTLSLKAVAKCLLAWFSRAVSSMDESLPSSSNGQKCEYSKCEASEAKAAITRTAPRCNHMKARKAEITGSAPRCIDMSPALQFM